MITRREFIRMGAAVGACMVVPIGSVERAMAFALAEQGQIANPLLLAKYVDHLPIPRAMPTAGRRNYYEVGAYPVQAKVHRDMNVTDAWGYRPSWWRQGAPEATYLGSTFVVQKDVPIRVKWSNNLVDGQGCPVPHPLPVDPSLDYASPFGDSMWTGPFGVDANGRSTFDYTLWSVPVSTHVHGAEVEPTSDGGPGAWFSPGWAETGMDWKHKVNRYPNSQPATTLWYHDHTMGITRLNVYMGLAGAYVVTDPGREPRGIPRGFDHHGLPLDIPLVLQDRMFDTDGQFYFPAISDNPTIHPFWVPEFFGDHMLVNGKAWPHLDVEPRAYRFRILDGSNARFYRIWLSPADHSDVDGPRIWQIGTDGGYLKSPVDLSVVGRPKLTVAPGERADVIVDFSAFAGQTLRMYNDAVAPFPMGDPTAYDTTGQIMEFRVRAEAPRVYAFPRNPLNPKLATFPSLNQSKSVKTRILTLNEVASSAGPLGAFLSLTAFRAPVSENPVEGTLETWKIVNTTGDTHPIHLHLTQVQLLSRQAFDPDAYLAAFTAVNGTTPFDGMNPNDSGKMAYSEVDPTPFLNGPVRGADQNECGWKDTVRSEPGEVTTLLVRFSPTDGRRHYPFDVTQKPGYVWHCHIIDHEDNDMMRPYQVKHR